MRSAFTRIFEHLLRVFCALIAHFALCPPILAKYQGAPRFVHSCALVCILSNDVHSSLTFVQERLDELKKSSKRTLKLMDRVDAADAAAKGEL